VESGIKALRYTKCVLGHASDTLRHTKDMLSTHRVEEDWF